MLGGCLTLNHSGSFNPCSRGCCARSVYQKQPVLSVDWFQSLFSWMLRSKGSAYRGGDPAGKFQSLFSWMLRSKVSAMTRHTSAGRFQSLFSWMLRSKTDRGIGGVPVECFNPCSRGCCARRSADYWSGYQTSGFNPCSRGCCARSHYRFDYGFLRHGFQSLFSWMLRSKSDARSASASR
jgi:hypothetical protein